MLTPDEIATSGLQLNLQRKLEVREVEGKGRGVLAAEPIRAGMFVLEYKTHSVYKRREMKSRIKEYDVNQEGSYIIEAQTQHGYLCFDATRRPFSMGRLINHSVKPNIKLHKPRFVRGKWRLAFLAVKDITVGEELLFDYGAPPQGHKWLYRNPKGTLSSIMGY